MRCENAGVAKLADAPDLGSGAARHVGSTPIARTQSDCSMNGRFFIVPIGTLAPISQNQQLPQVLPELCATHLNGFQALLEAILVGLQKRN